MFVTKKYIYTSFEKKKNEIEINGVKLNPFLLDFIEEPKKYYEDAYFYDYDFSFLGDFFYFDESVANINGNVFEHYLLMPQRRKELFNDLEPIRKFFEKYLKDEMTVITFEDLSEFGIKTLTPFEALSLENKLNKVMIKNRGKWVDINMLSDRLVYAKKFFLKIDKINEFEGVDGVCKLRVKREGKFLTINLHKKEIKIDLLELIKVENDFE